MAQYQRLILRDTDADAQPTTATEKSDPFGNAARAKL